MFLYLDILGDLIILSPAVMRFIMRATFGALPMNKHLSAILLSVLFNPVNLLAQFAFYDSLNNIHWAQIAPPSGGNLGYGQILREGLGYLTASDGELYEYDAARPQPWRRMPQPEPYAIHEYFALAPDDIWAAVEVPETYSRMLYHWDGQTWSPAFSGNVQKIRALYFTSPDEGWLGGEYGELWHYEKGRWQQQALPVFIHIERIKRLADRGLYVNCEAPQQTMLLRHYEGAWQTLFTATEGHFRVPILTPEQHLLITNDDAPAAQRLASSAFPIWQMPLLHMDLFPEGRGYGARGKTIYAIDDTICTPLIETPFELRGVYLFNEHFSWIAGSEGFLLAPQTQPVVAATPRLEQVFPLRVSELSNAYGLAVLQKRAGEPSHIYFVRTGQPNILLATSALNRSDVASYDEAGKFNLAGATEYDARILSADRRGLSNFDQALLTGDLNGDGRDDLIVIGMYGHPFVYLHSGRDYYFDATKFSGLQEWGYVEQRPMLGNLFDADRDGDLDLFIACQYRSNAFFLNNGRGQFTEVTQAAGLQTEGGGIGGFVADFDSDGWEDLYVTRVNRPNLLYRNVGVHDSSGGPRFADASAESGDACWPELKHSQGAALADYDNDGDCDIFVCNLETGNRLLQNDGKGRFTDVTSEAGLAAHDQSFGATFFDADNDGDLDLMVANRGKDRFYKNLGDGSFHEQSEQLGGRPSDRNLLMFPGRQFGSSSYGTLTFDFDGDEDLDVLMSNFDDGLFVLHNPLNAPNSALQIFPEGIISNRSAVGAKVFLYKAGRLSDAAALVGSRSIESATGYGCSPEKVAHFGVDPQAQYDAKIVFPSGAVREVRGMRGGDRLVVREIEGWAAEAIKARRTLVDLFTGYRSRARYVLFALGALSLSLLLYAGKNIVGLSQRDLGKLALLYGVCLLSVFLYWFAKTETAFVLRPLALSAAATILAILLMRTQRLYRGRVASMDMLHARLNAFDHGSLIRQLMDRLTFFAENLEPETKLSDETRRRLLEATSGVTHFLKNEIEAIRAYQDSNNFAMELAYRLDDTWALLKRVLKRLQGNLVQEENFDHRALRAAAELQGQMRELVADFKKRADQHYRAEICAVIQDYLRKSEHDSVNLNLPEALPFARILPADLAYVLDELVQNALRHIAGRRPKVVIQARHALDEIHLEVRDNGCGIPEHQWEQVFRPGFTTKRNAPGGFGLYHARQRLEKYGAKIFVAESTIGEGTTMRICLRAEES